MSRAVVIAALVGSAAAFHLVTPTRSAKTQVFSKYDGQVWDMDAKMDIWNLWDPNSPRSEDNFNPFERNPDGNACDTSGYFPGEGKYKDPQRPDMNWDAMLKEKELMAQVESNPKPGDVPGAPAASSRRPPLGLPVALAAASSCRRTSLRLARPPRSSRLYPVVFAGASRRSISPPTARLWTTTSTTVLSAALDPNLSSLMDCDQPTTSLLGGSSLSIDMRAIDLPSRLKKK
eukprot:CAMPEP_0197413950 /NCGR_PEP_ID=MMETSP1170-20131217/751_1 /TAXON_ID=54406 /ORGANISM="Sarcinochrysis sp, Strain CCMP770" /LENGTH=231 /DNA_ID=CAMNT_0042940613 /DNA_START=52 /DNA_END=745 /DNA_ORIENTATION=-